IKYSHPTAFRVETWFEFEARDVLQQLETGNKEIRLKDIRPCFCHLLTARNRASSNRQILGTTSQEIALFLQNGIFGTQVSQPFAKQIISQRKKIKTLSELAAELGYYGVYDEWNSPMGRLVSLCRIGKKHFIRDG